MKMSVREARSNFAAVLDAAARGESVTITKNGKPVAELGPPKKKVGFDWERNERVRKELGLDKMGEEQRESDSRSSGAVAIVAPICSAQQSLWRTLPVTASNSPQ